jgi:hypothetical protein
MRRSGVLARTVVATMFLFGFFALRVSSALAGDGTVSVTIHKAECFHGVGPDIFEKCHDNGLGGVDFLVTSDDTGYVVTTDDDGVASIEVPAGVIGVAEDPDVLAQYLGAYVYCSDQATGQVLFDSDLDGTIGVIGDLAAGTELLCDWYDITEAPADSGNSSSSGSSNTTLPSTGVGSTGGSDDALLLLTLSLTALALGGAVVARRRRTAL